MKFRTLGVALLMGSGLALTAMASPAVAQPYPPAGCTGPFGTGTVNPAVVAVGEETTFSGCGFEPFTIVQIAVDGVPHGTTLADSHTAFSVKITFGDAGPHTLTATGQQATTFDGPVISAPAALPTDSATGAVVVPAQAPYLTRVVTATVLATEEEHEWPGGGWGEPSGDPSGEPSTDPSATSTSSSSPTSEPTSTSSSSPTSEPTSTSSYSPSADPSSTSDPTEYPTDEPTTYPTADPSAGPSGEPVETVYPHDWDGKHHWYGEGEHHEGGLPFTGVETGALAAIAVALVGGGLLIRVAARKRRNAPGTHS